MNPRRTFDGLMKRIRLATIATAALVAPWVVSSAMAQAIPPGDIHLIVAFPPGSSSDVLVRYLADKLRPISGRTVVVENKPGAVGNIATQYMTRSKPDGLTILVHPATVLASNFYLIKNNPVDVRNDVKVAATVNRQAMMLVVDAKRPWRTISELTAHARERGDKATYGTIGSSSIIMCALYKERAGLTAVEVNYKNAPDSINDMSSGALDFACHDPLFALLQHRKGAMRILGVASRERLASEPDLPSMQESGFPMDLAGWFAAMVPAATPKPIVDQINAWFAQIHALDDTRKFLANSGSDPMKLTPEEGQARLLKDVEDWGEYVRIAKLTPQ